MEKPSRKVLGRWWKGCPATIAWGLGGCTALLITNLGLLGWASTQPDSGRDTRVLYEGECTSTGIRSTVAHLAINVLGVLLLASSNAAMQTLCAPTREDLDAAHAGGSWLHVGIGHLRNFRAMGALRRTAWTALFLSSIPLHLLYNSVILQSTSASEYYAVLATQDFGQGVPITTDAYSNYGVAQGGCDLNELYRIQNESAVYEKLSLKECLGNYGKDFAQGYSDVVLVSNLTDWRQSGTNSSVLVSTKYSPKITELQYNIFLPNLQYPIGDGPQSVAFPHLLSDGSIPYSREVQLAGGPPPEGRWVTVEYCLARKVPGVCTIELHPIFLIIVIIAGFVKIACFIWFLFGVFSTNALLTVDDAIASFLNRPDVITEGGFALSKSTVGCLSIEKLRIIREKESLSARSRKPWRTRRPRWSIALEPWQKLMMAAASVHVWIMFYFADLNRFIIWVTTGLLVLIQAETAIPMMKEQPTPLAQSFANGLGNLYPSTILPFSLTWSISSNILFANTPQLILSLVYVGSHQMINQMRATNESMRFATKRDALRVSTPPLGAQRSSYCFGLPMYCAIPLMIASAVLHWTLSQTLFLGEIVIQREDGTIKPPNERINAVGYSFAGLLIMFVVGGLMLLFMPLYSCIRRLPSGMPLLGTCSLSIAAACHGHSNRPDEALQRLRYGVVKITGTKTGRVGFSSGEVEPLQDTWYYDGNDITPAITD